MNMVELIEKKKLGKELSEAEIRWFVDGVTHETIPDYQTSAFLMAVIFKGLSKAETFVLTDAMLHSGEIMDLSGIPGVKVDKHSTGGVGDKTSLIVAPLAASCGVSIAKMSGRGLGFTGGTVDKMESIPGFDVSLTPDEFFGAVKACGMAITGQTADVAKADKKLYALRDVTGTVNNVSLIASSIMSKKLASGSDAIVLDVKCGKGAFMKTPEAAEELGKLMVEIGNNAGKKTVAVVTDMDQPLGKAVGNSLEVIEAVETLKGRGPADITDLALTLAGYMIFLGRKAGSSEEGKRMAREAMESGKGFATMQAFVRAQKGNPSCLTDYSLFKQPKYSDVLRAEKSGYIASITSDVVGFASQHLGAGRSRKEDPIDYSAGIMLSRKVGERVEAGEILATLYADDREKIAASMQELASAYTIADKAPSAPALIHKCIE